MFKRDCNTVPCSHDWIMCIIDLPRFRPMQHSKTTTHFMELSDHIMCTFTMYYDVMSWHIDRAQTTAHVQSIQLWILFNSSIDVASTGYIKHCTCCSLTFWHLHKLQLSHIKLYHSTGAGRARMQLAKVVITSVLVLAICSEGLPEGNKVSCVLKCTSDVKLLQVWWSLTHWSEMGCLVPMDLKDRTVTQE